MIIWTFSYIPKQIYGYLLPTEIMTYSESANHTESKNMSIMSVFVYDSEKESYFGLKL